MNKAKLGDPRIAAKYWEQIEITNAGCWKWTGSIITDTGYSRFTVNGVRVIGHRYFYQELIGPIPAGLVIDHTCHNVEVSCNEKGSCPHRACVNPAHLEAVTSGENVKRSSHTLPGKNVYVTTCPRGHAYDEVNTRVVQKERGSARMCRKCGAEKAAEKAALDRAAHLQYGRDYYAANRERLVADKRVYAAAKRAAKLLASNPVKIESA